MDDGDTDMDYGIWMDRAWADFPQQRISSACPVEEVQNFGAHG